MRILYLSQYFPPEAGATQTRSFEMARHLVRMGHHVTVIANIPNHPAGVVHPEFEGVKFRRVLMEEGIEVLYVWAWVFPEKSFKKRIAFYLSYMASAILAGMLCCREKFDCIYATSPPLFVGFSGVFLHWVKRIPLFFEVRDLWPESAVELGLVKDRLSIRLATFLEELIYRSSQALVTVTEGIRETLDARGIGNGNISVIPNGATPDSFFFDSALRQAKRRELGLDNCFVSLYAGLLGEAQDLDTILEAARNLLPEPRHRFVMAGAGPRAAELEKRAGDMGLSNMLFLGQLPRNAMPALYSAADAALVPLKDREVFKSAYPSKMFDSMCCQTPVLLGVRGMAQDILMEAGGGLAYEPENPQDMVRAIREMDALGETARRSMGEGARDYVVGHHSRESHARTLEKLLRESLGKD